jgi:hypothetical protein
MQDKRQRVDAFFNQRRLKGKWEQVRPEKLPWQTRDYLKLVLAAGWKVEQLSESCEGCYLFRVEGCAEVRYLIHDSDEESHIWGDADWNDVDNEAVGWLLAGSVALDPKRRFNWKNLPKKKAKKGG